MTGQVVLSQAQANLKMSLWQVEAEVVNSSDLYVWLSECGLPHEVAIRLHDLTTYTEKVGNKVFAVGKIILLKIIEFVNAHPALVAGFGMGVTVGIVVNHLVSSIPGIGYLLAPLATALATTLGIFIFGVAGHRVDKRTQGKEVQEGIIGIAEDVIEIVVVFFQLLADVFNIVFRNVITS